MGISLPPRTLAVLLSLALAASGCGEAPPASEGPASGPGEAPSVSEGPASGSGGSGSAVDSSHVDSGTVAQLDSAAAAEADSGVVAEPATRRPPPAAVTLPDDGTRPRFRQPDSMRGIYLNAWAAGSSKRMEEFLRLARETEVNTFVIDIKDASGYVSHPSGVELAREIGALGEIRIRDLPGLLRRLQAEGIYPIARIVIVKDPLLVASRPELAVQDTAGGIWIDSKKLVWLNPYDERVWDYHVELAEEVALLGFPEIQWDYVRFPDAPASDMARAVFPGDSVGVRAEAIRSFLGHARTRLDSMGLDVEMTVDVFGVTTSFTRDVGIGQLWERFIDRVDAALPMVYPSHYWEDSFGFKDPNAHPYEIVLRALRDANRRSAAVEGAGEVRPWLQDFTLGSPRYGAPEVRAQIQATYDAGLNDWILWNPGSRYTEDALEPVDGFPEEPLVRVAGEIVPVSQRNEALERVARRAAEADSASRVGATGEAADTLTADPAPVDTLTVDPVPVDTVSVDTVPDTTVARPDTVGVRRPLR